MAQPRFPSQPAAKAANTRYTISNAEGLQLHANRNLFQLTALVVVASVGAVLG